MNAVMRKYDGVEGTDMPTNENEGLAIEVAKLRSDVSHIQADVTDIKADLRITNQRIESMDKKFDQKFDSLDKKFDQKLESLDLKFDKKLESFRLEVDKRFTEVMNSLASAKHWAFGLYIGLAASLFYVLAHGFKWL